MAHFYSRTVLSIYVRKFSQCINLNDAYIISAVRTPIGCFFGKLAPLNVVHLGATALRAAVDRAGLCKEDIQEIVLGNFCSAGAGQLPAHQMAMISGFSTAVISSMIGKACASGMKAITYGCQLISTNAQEIIAVGGAESLSNVPYLVRRRSKRLGNLCMLDPIFSDALYDPIDGIDIIQFVEETAREYNCTRKDQDDFALNSYAKASAARRERVFDAEVVPVVIKKKTEKGECEEVETVCEDEQISQLKVEKFREIQPEIGPEGTVTSGNSSGLHDGAAILIIASGNYVLKKNLNPLARIVSYSDASLEPRKLALASSAAVSRALIRCNLSKDDISLWEISETYALTAIVNANTLKIDLDRVNLHGGSISLGHPFGMTGARLVLHLAHALKGGELGCAAICHGGGGGSAVIIEKL